MSIAVNKVVKAGSVSFGNHLPMSLIAGPCQMESRNHALEMASAMKEICSSLGIGYVYKTSYDKANRTSLSGKRGVGLAKAMEVFAEIKESLGLPVSLSRHTTTRTRPHLTVPIWFRCMR